MHCAIDWGCLDACHRYDALATAGFHETDWKSRLTLEATHDTALQEGIQGRRAGVMSTRSGTSCCCSRGKTIWSCKAGPFIKGRCPCRQTSPNIKAGQQIPALGGPCGGAATAAQQRGGPCCA